MKTIKWILTGAVLLSIFAMGCTPGDPEQTALTITQPEGTAALQRYVAIGNSLTAGYMDSGLIMDGQASAYPLRIALQLGYSPDPNSDDWFGYPLTAWPGIGTTDTGDPSQVAGVLHWNGSAIAIRGVTPADEVEGLLLARAYPTPYANLGVVGAYAGDVPATLTYVDSIKPANRYFDFTLRNPTFGNYTMLEQAVAQGPTLVTLWVGNNDILLAATGGDPVLGGGSVTEPDDFAATLEEIVTGLHDGINGRFGYHPNLVVGNVPSITTIPHFIPKALFDQAVGVPGYPTDETGVVYVTFSGLGLVQGGWTDPLPSTVTLTDDEVALVEQAVTDYNTEITSLAAEYDFTVVDVNAGLAALDPAQLTHFVFLLEAMGGDADMAAATTVFSLDGIHPNNQGQSILANLFIEGINAQLELTGGDALMPVPVMPWDPTYPPPGGGGLAAVLD